MDYGSNNQPISNLAVGLIVGAICSFLALLGLVVRQFIVSHSCKDYDILQTTIEESSEQIWDQKDQPPAYNEEEQQQEEKKPFLA